MKLHLARFLSDKLASYLIKLYIFKRDLYAVISIMLIA